MRGSVVLQDMCAFCLAMVSFVPGAPADLSTQGDVKDWLGLCLQEVRPQCLTKRGAAGHVNASSSPSTAQWPLCAATCGCSRQVLSVIKWPLTLDACPSCCSHQVLQKKYKAAVASAKLDGSFLGFEDEDGEEGEEDGFVNEEVGYLALPGVMTRGFGVEVGGKRRPCPGWVCEDLEGLGWGHRVLATSAHSSLSCPCVTYKARYNHIKQSDVCCPNCLFVSLVKGARAEALAWEEASSLDL